MKSTATVPTSLTEPELRRGIARWFLRNAIIVAIAAGCLFLTSRDTGWGMAWAYLGVLLASKVGIGVLLARSNPELLAQRGGMPEDAKPWDRPLAMTMALWGPVLGWIVAGLDRRYAWSSGLPPILQVVGLVVAILGSLTTLWAMISNRFFFGFVRVAREQGHRVAVGGPYRFLRHPGYLGAVVYQLATPLALNSLLALGPVTLTIGATVARAALEDRVLLQELEGYIGYAQEVRFRLLPGLW